MKSKLKDISILVVGALSSIMGFLATLNIKFEWLTEASISALGTAIVAVGMLFAGLYAIWKNTYVSKKAKEQAKILEQKGLK